MALTTFTLVAAMPPKVTAVSAESVNPVPVMVIVEFPATGPMSGETLPTVGAGSYVNALVSSSYPFRLVTLTVTAPGPAAAGVRQVRLVALTTFTLVAAMLPKVTVVSAESVNPVPVIAMAVFPETGPTSGATVPIPGGSADIEATNASSSPLYVKSGPTATGNVFSLDFVQPVTYALPFLVTAMASATSY